MSDPADYLQYNQPVPSTYGPYTLGPSASQGNVQLPYPQAGPSCEEPPPYQHGGYSSQDNYPGTHAPYFVGQPPMNQHTTGSTVIVHQPATITLNAEKFREDPVQTSCPYCHASILTVTRYDLGACVWVSFALLCLFGCNLGCCLIPFCATDCQDVIHQCPNCKHQIKRWNRL